ncbi:hypothetical protein [Virgisporangium aurantiacum]|nr:hypothetical protein [Virgisporangium aurantiacum]
MSLTEAENVFAGLNETGLNDMLRAIFTARPRLLNYRTSPAVTNNPVSASAWTTVPVIAFPGVPGGIEYAVQFDIPQSDIAPQSAALPPPLTLGPGQISLRTAVTLTLLCRSRQGGNDQQPAGTSISVGLEAAAVGRIVVRSVGLGSGSIAFDLQRVELVDVTPEKLESLLECLILTFLRGALASVELPFSAIRLGAFSLNLLRGPESEDDQLKLYGAAV